MNAKNDQGSDRFGRREFLARASALGVGLSVSLVGKAAAERPLETTKVRLVHAPAICFAPQYLAEELLRLDGFTDVEYVEENVSTARALAAGRADFSMDATPAFLPVIDKGMPVAVLAGIHAGCYELFGHGDVRAIRDLKGKRVAITTFGAIEHVLVSSMVAYVGINPKEIDWVQTGSNPDAMRLFEERKADAFLGFPPQPKSSARRESGGLS